MKKSRLVPLLFTGAILLPGCGSGSTDYGSRPTPGGTPTTGVQATAPYFVTCKVCKTINEVSEGGAICRNCGQPLEVPRVLAPVTSPPVQTTTSGGYYPHRSIFSTGPTYYGPSYSPLSNRPFSSGGPLTSGPRTYSSGSSSRTPLSPTTSGASHSSSSSSFTTSTPSHSSSSGSSISRGGFGSSAGSSSS